jgi:LuxR family transcriptional regulator, maltose regulon positive regulatory protein
MIAEVAKPMSDESGLSRARGRLDRGRPRRPFELSDSKTHPPVARPGIVNRTALLGRMKGAAAPRLLLLIAPAGYGKTTVLAQWAQSKGPRAAWLSADHRDNDPAVLLTYLAAIFDRVEAIDPSVLRALIPPSAPENVVPLLGSVLQSMRDPMFLILDHAEAITNRECLDAITELAFSVPPGSQFAIASRADLPLPTGRLRAEGAILEIRASELAMNEEEAALLLHEAGVDLRGGDVRDLVERTEGWPAGLYLAALAVNAGTPPTEAVFSFTGDDRYMGDYLRSEFLDRVSRAEVSFLTRTSILDRMCGSLCDATLNVRGSDEVLERLDSRNLLVVPLDHRRDWYRYHQLFRQLLHAELRRREGDMIPILHLRAAAWYEGNAEFEAAIEHAQAANDANWVARLVLKWMQPVWASGRVDTVLDWMEWLEDKTWVEHYSAIAAHGALILGMLGRPGAAERWAAAAELAASSAVLPNGDTMEGVLFFMQAVLCRRGLTQMREDARAALDGLSPASPHRWGMLHTEGISHLLEGDPAKADTLLAHATDVATASRAAPAVALTLAERAIAAIERGDWPAAETLADQALTIVSQGQFDSYWTSALVYACGARIAASRGDVAKAREYTAKAARLRPLLTYALPVVSVQTLLDLGRAYLALGDSGGVMAVLRQAQDIFQQRPDLGVLPQQAAELRRELHAGPVRVGGSSSLTTAELRLLPLLSTHLTLKEISDRLYLSRNTVKTQAASVYRKFGVNSRGEAVVRMHELGLLAHAQNLAG